MALVEGLLGASRNGAGLGAEQSVLENCWTERRIGSSLACEHTAARKVQWGRSGGDWFFFLFCVLSVLSSLDLHLCRSSPLWHAWAAHIKEKV